MKSFGTESENQLQHGSIVSEKDVAQSAEKAYTITVSALAGIDPEEPFDVSPYANALLQHLQDSVQEYPQRKISFCFSSSEHDAESNFTYDLVFVPKTEIIEGKLVRGFKILPGGGFSVSLKTAQVAFDFLPADELIAFCETFLRLLNVYGEHKPALAEVLRHTAAEHATWMQTKHFIAHREIIIPAIPAKAFTTFRVSNDAHFCEWKSANTFEQKQQGWFGVYVQFPQVNIDVVRLRSLVAIAQKYSAADVRATTGQRLLVRFVPESALPALYRELKANGFTDGSTLQPLN